MKNQIYIGKDFGWFLGSFDDNKKHKHYAIQVSIPLEKEILIKTNKEVLETGKAILIQSNVTHQLISDASHFLLLLNPASKMGHFWGKLSNKDIQEIDLALVKKLKNILVNPQSTSSLATQINLLIEKNDCFCETAIHNGDERVDVALLYLQNNFDRIVSLKEIANYSNLSQSRFLHLFKEQTGITYRRAQLWVKIQKAISLFGRMSFTEIAHQVGFSDSAHLSRTFKENFGFSPRDFIKLSQFIQV